MNNKRLIIDKKEYQFYAKLKISIIGTKNNY